MMSHDDNDGQIIFGELGGPKLPDIRLTGEEKPRKKPHPGNLSRPGIEPGPAAWQERMLPLAPQRWTLPLVMTVGGKLCENQINNKVIMMLVMI